MKPKRRHITRVEMQRQGRAMFHGAMRSALQFLPEHWDKSPGTTVRDLIEASVGALVSARFDRKDFR